MSLIEKWKEVGYEAYAEGDFWTHLGTVETDLQKVIDDVITEMDKDKLDVRWVMKPLKQKIFGDEK